MDAIWEIYKKSNSRRDFYRKLEDSGLRLIYKKERVVGFRDAGGRRFDLAKIGIHEIQLNYLDRKQEIKLMRIQDRLSRLEQKEHSPKLTHNRTPKH